MHLDPPKSLDKKMYRTHPKCGLFSKIKNTVEDGLRIYGTAKGLYDMGSAVAGAARTAYSVAGPALSML